MNVNHGLQGSKERLLPSVAHNETEPVKLGEQCVDRLDGAEAEVAGLLFHLEA